MSMTRIIGMMFLAAGLLLLIFGIHAAQSVTERVVEGVTGRFTNQTTWFFIGGVVCLVGGSALTFWGKRPTTP